MLNHFIRANLIFALLTSAAAMDSFLPQSPTITFIIPISGTTAGGTIVSIAGENLDGVAVTFGGIPAQVFSTTSTEVAVSTPAHGEGLVDIVVTNSVGSATRQSAFAYISPAPIITSIVPISGPITGGTLVTITGTNLNGASVMFDGLPARIVSNSSTQVEVLTPAHEVGVVDVIVTTSQGSASDLGVFSFTNSNIGGGNGGGGSAFHASGSCGLGSGFAVLMAVLSLMGIWKFS